MKAWAYATHLRCVDPGGHPPSGPLQPRCPLHKLALPGLHEAAPLFGGLIAGRLGSLARLFNSSGFIFGPELSPPDPRRAHG